MNSAQIKVALIEDDQEIRNYLAALIDKAPDIKCQQTFSQVEDALTALVIAPPDVILMDITLPGINGIEGVYLFKEKLPDTEIIMLTIHQENKLVFDSLCAGACGYLTKHTPYPKIIEAIREAKDGGAPMSTNIARMVVNTFQRKTKFNLSAREKEVLSELCQGKSYKIVADSLFISEDTVRSHIRNIYKKLEVNSKSEAIIKAMKNRLI